MASTEQPSPPNPKRPGRQPEHNWPVIRAYWLALSPEERTFKAAGARFGVTAERVGQIARRDGWLVAAKDLDLERERAEDRELRKMIRRDARQRAERLSRTLELYDRTNDLALELLPLKADGSVDVAALGDARPTIDAILGRMPGLFKMAELAAGEATDRVAVSEVQPVLLAFARIAVMRAPAGERGEVMRELEAASSGLIPLGEAA